MADIGDQSRLDVIIRRASAFADQFRREEMRITGEAAMHGRLGSASVEVMKLEAAKRLYRDACVSVITDMGSETGGLEELLEKLEPLFYRKENPSRAFGTPYDPGFPSALSQVRTNILQDLAHGFKVMGKNDNSTKTEIHQHGANSLAVSTGSHSNVSVSAAYSHMVDLIPAAMAEARGYAVSDEHRNDIIDHIQTIADETKKDAPDQSRLKRFANRLAHDLGAAKDAAVAAGGAAFGTGAVDALVKSLTQ